MCKRAAVVGLIAAMVLAACSGDDGGEGTAGTGGSDTASVSTDGASTTSTTDGDADATTTTAEATTTTVELVTEGATVVVANSSIAGGAAGRMTEELAGAGFTTGTATNGTDRLETSIVYYTDADGAQEVAESVGAVLGGVDVEAVPDPVPTESGTLEGAQVLVMLGNAQADRTLEELEVSGAVGTSGSVVVVANDAGVDGAAGAMSTELELAGFDVGTPTNGIEDRADSVVYFTDADGAEDDAELLAETMGGLEVGPMPDPIPTETGEIDGDVLLLLGTNQAGKSLDELNP
jgi:hypothetical protein